MRRILLGALLLPPVLYGVPATAQEQHGAIEGVVQDAQGAILPGVTIQAHNVTQGGTVTTVSDRTGVFRFATLPPGYYDVTATLAGYRGMVRGGKWPISSDGGTDPAWSPDGGELFYRHGDGLVSVPIQVKSEFQAGRPKPLFEARYEAQDGARNYDVAPDGQHFVVVRADDAAQPTEFRMVINWFEELRARVPAP